MSQIVRLSDYRQKKISPPIGSPRATFAIRFDGPVNEAVRFLELLRQNGCAKLADTIEQNSEVYSDD